MNTRNIILSSYNANETRLERVLGYICALAEQSKNNTLFSKIKSMYDYKGKLTVTWKTAPTLKEENIILKAWESPIGDGGGEVVHVIDKVNPY